MQDDVGIALKKARQPGHHEVLGKGALGVHAQQPLGRGVQEGAVGLFQVGQQAHAALVIGLAVVRQPHLARGALQQPGAQARFHALDQVGDRGAGNLQVFRRLGKAAPFGDADKHLHFLETIHADPPLLM
ncbi:hypothetical protein D3C78_1529060 [compost metagenome]